VTQVESLSSGTLSREELHELVWSKPTSDLAKKFGVGDLGLVKRCKRLDIRSRRTAVRREAPEDRRRIAQLRTKTGTTGKSIATSQMVSSS
jgi:hypothetical protein